MLPNPVLIGFLVSILPTSIPTDRPRIAPRRPPMLLSACSVSPRLGSSGVPSVALALHGSYPVRCTLFLAAHPLILALSPLLASAQHPYPPVTPPDLML